MADTVLFRARVPLNIVVRLRSGGFEIVQDRRNGIPWPAGEPFPVPAACADEFEARYGPRQGDEANVSPAARRDGLIAGLARCP